MFKSEPALSNDGPAFETAGELYRKCKDLAVEISEELYRKCFELGSGNPILGLALPNIAMQYQAGEFGDDIAEFDKRVAALLTEANAIHDAPSQ